MNRMTKRILWRICGWLALCVLMAAGLGGWWAQSRSDELVLPQQSDTTREIGLSLANDLGRAVRLRIPVQELVGVPEWLADVVAANPAVDGLVVTDLHGHALFQSGQQALPTNGLPSPLAEGEHVADPWLVNILAVRESGNPQAVAWLLVFSAKKGLSVQPWIASFAVAVIIVSLAVLLLGWGFVRGVVQPARRTRLALQQLAHGQWPDMPGRTSAAHWFGATAFALQARCTRLLERTESILQKLSEVRAAHFDPTVLARIDALALPLLVRQPQIVQHRLAPTQNSLLQRMTVLQKLWACALLGGGLTLTFAVGLAQLHAQDQQRGLIQTQQRLLAQAWQATLAQDQARMEALLRHHSGLADWIQSSNTDKRSGNSTPDDAAELTDNINLPNPLQAELPPGMHITVLNADGSSALSTAGRNHRPQPDAITLAGMDAADTAPASPRAVAQLVGSWQGQDRSFQTGLIRPVQTSDGMVFTVVLSRPVSGVVQETAARTGGELALADLRDQPEHKEPSAVIDAWLTNNKVNHLAVGPAGTDVLVSMPLESLSGHALGTLIARQTVTPRLDSSQQVGRALGWLGLALSLMGTLWLLRVCVGPLAQASQRLRQLALDDASPHATTEPAHDIRVAALEQSIDQVNSKIEALKTLRRSRERQGKRQARFIRHQMMQLASSLDDTARAGILADLERIEESSKHDAASADALPAQNRTGAHGHLGFESMADEVGILALGFQNLVGRVGDQYQQLGRLVQELREALRVKTQFIAIQQELEIARKMQLSILPHDFSHQSGVTVHGTMQAAKEVGGDFYDFFRVDEHHLAVTVADVSGKGIPAAFFMAVSRTLLRAVAQFESEPSTCLERLNDLLAADNEETMFVTLFYAVIDTRTGHVVYGNAGHNPPYVLRANGTLEALATTGGMALAVMDGIPYSQRSLQLQPGDALFMYTDGVTEACRADQTLFGEARLEQLLTQMVSVPVAQVAERVIATIKAFEDGNPQSDDITCLMVRLGQET